MTRRYSVAEAKDRLPAVLHEAEDGQPTEITRNGQPVAVLLSVGAFARLQAGRRDLADSYAAWRAQGTLTDAEVDALADASRDQDPKGIEW